MALHGEHASEDRAREAGAEDRDRGSHAPHEAQSIAGCTRPVRLVSSRRWRRAAEHAEQIARRSRSQRSAVTTAFEVAARQRSSACSSSARSGGVNDPCAAQPLERAVAAAHRDERDVAGAQALAGEARGSDDRVDLLGRRHVGRAHQQEDANVDRGVVRGRRRPASKSSSVAPLPSRGAARDRWSRARARSRVVPSRRRANDAARSPTRRGWHSTTTRSNRRTSAAMALVVLGRDRPRVEEVAGVVELDDRGLACAAPASASSICFGIAPAGVGPSIV